MRTQGAAPGGGYSGAAGSAGNSAILTQPGIPAHVLERLRAEGIDVTTLGEWRALGRRRFQVWGITRRTALELDKLARGAA